MSTNLVSTENNWSEKTPTEKKKIMRRMKDFANPYSYDMTRQPLEDGKFPPIKFLPITAQTTEIKTYTVTGSAVKLDVVDAGTYSMVYRELAEIGMTLTYAGCRVLMYLIYKMPVTKTYLELRHDQFALKCNASTSTFYRGVDELIELDVIRSRKDLRVNTYWVNPLLLYNGQRLQKFNTHYDLPEEYNRRKQIMANIVSETVEPYGLVETTE